jgi:hypothetical protein
VRFEAAGDGTRITLEHRGLDGVRTYNVTDPEVYEWGFMQSTGKGYEQGPGGLEEIRAGAS